MRLFFALLPEPMLSRRIADWRDAYLTAQGRPVPVANLHSTLAFLGEVSPHRLEGLCDNVDHLLGSAPLPGGSLKLDQVGYWPKPGIFWLGPTTWSSALERLSAHLRGCAGAAGAMSRQQRFRPHITLFRGCRQPPPAPASPPGFDFPYEDISLLQSRSTRHGVQYEEVANWPLAPADSHAD